MAPRAKQAKVTKACETCGKDVTRNPWEFREHVYCSHRCYANSPAHAERIRSRTKAAHPDALQTVTCAHCGNEFDRVASRLAGKAEHFCSRDCQYAYKRSLNLRTVTAGGYIVIGVPADYPGAKRNGNYGQIFEHRKVMQEMLGRPLLPLENVHHINGVKDDNRPENLELWTRSQPSGQRVRDKLAWARMIIDLYGDMEVAE